MNRQGDTNWSLVLGRNVGRHDDQDDGNPDAGSTA